MKEKLKQFVEEKRGVSPVIGVVLMVAVVVILAAVIGAFVLGLGGSQSATPQAAFTYDAATGTVTMASGESIESAQLSVEGATGTFSDTDGDNLVEAGDSITNAADDNNDGSIDVIWTNPGGESAIITSFDVDGDGGDDGGNP